MECGYTFDAAGVVGALTVAEERMLWRGRALWYEHVEPSENGGDGAGGGGAGGAGATHTGGGVTGRAKGAARATSSVMSKYERFKSQTETRTRTRV